MYKGFSKDEEQMVALLLCCVGTDARRITIHKDRLAPKAIARGQRGEAIVKYIFLIR